MPYRVCKDTWFSPSDFPETTRNIYFLTGDPSHARPEDVDEYVLAVIEPEVIHHGSHVCYHYHKNFDTILTHDPVLLAHCPNAKLCVYGTSWISPSVYNSIDISKKQRKISSITGSKELTPAHTYRKVLYKHQMSITPHSAAPITWFRSSQGQILPNIHNNPIIHPGQNSKDILFTNYQFSIVIENCRQENYFTEKLIDCLITKTIPIYYGCPNISNWFDVRGWVILETTTLEEFRMKIQRLVSYPNYINVINENYERAKQYASYPKNIQRVMNLGV